MNILRIGIWSLAMVLGACGGVTVGHSVGGKVRGLWDGAESVVLQLEASGTKRLLTVPGNDKFRFVQPLDEGTTYTITIASHPKDHQCAVDGGGTGIVPDDDIMNVSIACSGPVMGIDLSGQWGWTFDPTQDTQMFVGSVLVQDVTLTIHGDRLSQADVNGISMPLNKQMAPIALPLGMTMVSVVLTTADGLSKSYQLTFDRKVALDQVVYGKASNTGEMDQFGYSVALSGDTLAVGAFQESSSATGINGNEVDNRAPSSGAVYVFVRTGDTWSQQAYIKASNTGVSDGFGASVALSGDTLAVGAKGEDSGAKGINGKQDDDTVANSGAVYVFARSGTTWTQQAYIKASNPDVNDLFGHSVALSGNTLAVGARSEDSAATGVNGTQLDNTAVDSGAVYVFFRTGATWTQQAYIKASNTGGSDGFGQSVALSGDTLAVGAELEDSAATGVNGPQVNESTTNAGAVYVFVRRGITWVQQAYIKASNTDTSDSFGHSVTLSDDTLAVGALLEDCNSTGIGGSQTNNTAMDSGAVYVFVRTGATWSQQAYIKASNTGNMDNFGNSVALSGDTLAVGSLSEDSKAFGANGNQADDSVVSSGAVYVFVRSGMTWTQKTYVKASNPGANDSFGFQVALSSDMLAVGAFQEESSAVGINPVNGQTDNGVSRAGAVYVFR